MRPFVVRAVGSMARSDNGETQDGPLPQSDLVSGAIDETRKSRCGRVQRIASTS